MDKSGIKKTACCYTVDERFLFPTLLSASQLKSYTKQLNVDVVVSCFGDPSALVDAAKAFCKDHKIIFITVPRSTLNSLPLICARFILPQILDNNYDEILYLDGDTQIASSVTALIAANCRSGSILAAPDPMAIMINEGSVRWRRQRDYFNGIGLSTSGLDGYFNSGVIKANLVDWSDISKECLLLCARDLGRYKFLDQDALNIVLQGRCDLISFRWNFPPFFFNFNCQKLIPPSILHFMSNPRPWHGALPPWDSNWHINYVNFAKSYPKFEEAMPRLSAPKFYRYYLQQRFKRVIEKRLWGKERVVNRILALEAKAFV